jgi:hypothetical protein
LQIYINEILRFILKLYLGGGGHKWKNILHNEKKKKKKNLSQEIEPTPNPQTTKSQANQTS